MYRKWSYTHGHGSTMRSGESGLAVYQISLAKRDRMLDNDFELKTRGQLVIQVHLPSAWNDKSGSRMILRLKNASTGDTVSMRVTYGKTYQIENDKLPKGAYGSLVAWIDTVCDGNTSPYTLRTKPKSLKDIDRISSLVTLQQPVAPDNTALGRTEHIMNACRWISTTESRRETKRLTKNIISRVGGINSGHNSFIRMLLKSAADFNMIDDGTDIINQMLFLYFSSRIQVAARTQPNGMITGPTDNIDEIIQELSSYKSFVSLTVLQRCLKHSTSKSYDKILLRKSLSADPDRRICEQNTLTGDSTFGYPAFPAVTPISLQRINEDPSKKKSSLPVILYSADPKYLRAYLPRLIYYVSVFKSFKYHIHIVAPKAQAESMAAIVESCVRAVCEIREISRDEIDLDMSWSECPSVIPSIASYAASVRYLVAEEIMNICDRPVWVQDVDLYPTGDITQFLSRLQQHHVSMFKSTFLGGILPWIKYLAGNVYVSNTREGRDFLKHIATYLYSFLSKTESWMVDQNALAYAVEAMGHSIVIGDTREMKLPLQQSALASLIEI